MQKVGFGGGCHWCTEAVFSSLKGVESVEQGWIRAKESDARTPSEAVIVYYDREKIPLDILVEVHLFTHNATANHSMREKYRSAIYTFLEKEHEEVRGILVEKQALFHKPLVTKVYHFDTFTLNQEKFLNYYQKNRTKPFCQTYIAPKLQMLLKRYSHYYVQS